MTRDDGVLAICKCIILKEHLLVTHILSNAPPESINHRCDLYRLLRSVYLRHSAIPST